MREGQQLRGILMNKEQAVASDWGDHGDCRCPVCVPAEAKPAGQASPFIHTNRVNRCNKEGHVSPRKPGGQEMHSVFDSTNLSLAMDQERSASVPPAHEEGSFNREMGRKVRHARAGSPGAERMMPHRSISRDRTPMAGTFNQEAITDIAEYRAKSRQRWQGGKGDEPPRSGVAFILAPRGDDPPPPTQVVHVRRGNGEFKGGATGQAENLTLHFNQELFRFDGNKGVRSMSVPPDFRGSAGARSLHTPDVAAQKFGGPNPVTMQGHVDPNKMSLGDTNRATFRGTGQSPHLKTSAASNVTNQEGCNREFAMESSMRRQQDKTFASLCDYTANQDSSRSARELKNTIGLTTSPGIKSALTWMD